MRLHRILAAGCTVAGLALCSAAATAAPATSAPAVHESFTLLPCPGHPTTTVQIEGCAEHKVLALDKTIDALNAKVFARLGSGARARFNSSNSEWLAYRRDACTAEASIYQGATIQPIAFANCLVSLDDSHVHELKAMLVALSPAG